MPKGTRIKFIVKVNVEVEKENKKLLSQKKDKVMLKCKEISNIDVTKKYKHLTRNQKKYVDKYFQRYLQIKDDYDYKFCWDEKSYCEAEFTSLKEHREYVRWALLEKEIELVY